METSTLKIIKTLRENGISLFSLTDFARLFSVTNTQTLYKKIQRLEKAGIIEKLINGKYYFKFGETNDYTIANRLYAPSYISLESALSYYGIITGFPYMITSITVRKSLTIRCQNKDFVYSRITPKFYFGAEKDHGFLIASPEKALLDYLYFGNKGLRNKDFEEMDFSIIDRNKLALYARTMSIRKLPL